MNYTLTDTQQAVVEKIADAEMRSVNQVVGLLLAEGINWTYVDYSPRYGDIDSSKLEDQIIKEIKDSL
jgi:hypothetical protein